MILGYITGANKFGGNVGESIRMNLEYKRNSKKYTHWMSFCDFGCMPQNNLLFDILGLHDSIIEPRGIPADSLMSPFIDTTSCFNASWLTRAEFSRAIKKYIKCSEGFYGKVSTPEVEYFLVRNLMESMEERGFKTRIVFCFY